MGNKENLKKALEIGLCNAEYYISWFALCILRVHSRITRDVVEVVRAIREKECPQHDVFDENGSMTKVPRWRTHSRVHKHIHGVCEPTCGSQVSPWWCNASHPTDVHSTRELGEPGGDSQHLVSRRKLVYTSGKEKYLERGVEKEGQRCPVSIRVKCGSTYR